jgi:SAM-dependent methyltransferase
MPAVKTAVGAALAATSPALYEWARLAKRNVVGRLSRTTYKEGFADQVMRFYPAAGRRVLVVGANTGDDCRLFVERGATEVHGIDVMPSVGEAFKHDRVTYHCAGIERSGLPSGYFDLVVAFDTMEHVPDIEAGFSEMARLARPGGAIYTVSDPLWQSPYGHHMRCFDGHPWIHLACDRGDLAEYAERHRIPGDLSGVISYMFNPEHFNMRPAADYIRVCSTLPAMSVVRNDLASEPVSLLRHPLGRLAMSRGYVALNLLATTHTLVARKAAR